MQEFIYYCPNGLDFPLNEHIQVSTNINDIKDKNFLISNSNSVKCELVCKEVDIYIKNSLDNFSDKIKNVSLLYEMAATKYDYAQDISNIVEVSNKILLITNSKEQYNEFLSAVDPRDFAIFRVDLDALSSIDGTIGNFRANFKNEEVESIDVSMVVWYETKDKKFRNGIYDPILLGIEKTVSILKDNIENSFLSRKITTYNPTICQYDERREVICSKCEEVCPTIAITKDDKNKKLSFSSADCIDCGECVSICPSGSLDYAPINRTSFFEISKFYKDKHPFITFAKDELFDISLKENILPLVLDSQFLDESTLLTLLQTSGSQIIIYAQNLSEGIKEAIDILNEVYQRRFLTNAILLAQTQDELKDALEKISFVENSYFNFNQNGLKKREVFSQRLARIVGNDDLGVVKTKELVHYGTVKVNQDNCTLCLSCVGACNVDALIANEADFSLRINPSLCTACGYCEVSCPEKDCLSVVKDEIELQPLWFKENILAKDKLFACVECGKEFATAKAVEKIAAMMAPIFAKVSETKKRTLYCCEDCKAKLMIKQGLLDA